MIYSIEFNEGEETTTCTEAFSSDEAAEQIEELLDERGTGNFLIEINVEEE